MLKTAGREALRRFFDDNPDRNQTWLAARLSISQPSVSAWLRGSSRPEPHLREALELLVGIPRDHWNTSRERSHVERIRRCVEADRASAPDGKAA